MKKLETVFNRTRKELEALEELKGLKDFFKAYDNRVFNKRITDQLPDNITIKLNQRYDRMQLDVRINKSIHYSDSFTFSIYHTGYGKDLKIHPLDENKRIQADNIEQIIDYIVEHKQEYLGEILNTDLEALSKALQDLINAQKVLKGFNTTLISDGLEFWPDIYATEKAIRNMAEYQEGG